MYIIKGLPVDYNTENIAEALQEEGITILHINPIKYLNANKHLLFIFFFTVENNLK